MAYLTRQQALDIINKAPSNLNKESLLKELARTNTIEGYNEQAPKSNILKDIGREIIKPFAQGAELVSSGGKAFGSVLKAGYQSATGNKEAAKKTIIEAAKKAENRPELNILGQKVANIKTGKQAVGTALNLASNFVGGGAAKNIVGGIAKQTLPRLIWQGAKQGAKAGALYGAGTALQEDRNVITGALKGTAGGAIGGAVFPIAGKALKVATSPFSTAINKISPKLDKIANKIETIITKPSKQDLAHGFKTENIFKYDLGGGLGKSLNKTQNLIDDLVTRAENIRGESRSIIDLSPIIKEASDEIANSKITNIGNNKKILNAFKLWVKEIEDIAPEGKVDTVGAQKIKVALGRMGSWLNGQRDLDSSAMESVSNVLYTKFKNAVENAVDDPAELRAINQQLSELIPISNVLTKRIPIADRNSIMPLTDIIGTSAGLIEPKAWGVVAVNKLSKSGGFANLLYKGSQKLKSGATKLLPLETGIKKSLKNIKPGLTIEDVSKKKLKYKTTVNIQDKNDLEYLGRILSEDNINDIKSGKMVNFRGTPYEDLARVNIISKKPLTVEQQLSGKISDVKLKSDTFYHGTSAENAKSIMSSGFKKGSELPEDIFRGGGYGKMQNSISLADTPKDASRFSKLTRGGEIVEAKLKPNSKIVSIKGIEDANDLDDFLPYLKKQKIDAVYIGGGEKELVVINPEVVTPTKSQLTDIWNKANKLKTKLK